MEIFIIVTVINFLSLLLVYLITRKANEGLRRQTYILGQSNEGIVNSFSVRAIKTIYPLIIITITIIFYILLVF